MQFKGMFFMVTQAQMRATRRYAKRHPEKNKLYQYRSNAKTFIKHYADKDDLDKLISLAQEQKAKRLSDEGAKLRLPVKKQVN